MKIPARLSLALVLTASLHAESLPTTKRLPGEDVDSAALRTRQGLSASDSLLFNGWGVSPAGQHVACGDLALKILIAPDRKAAIAVCAGYNKQGVNIVSLDAKREVAIHRAEGGVQRAGVQRRREKILRERRRLGRDPHFQLRRWQGDARDAR